MDSEKVSKREDELTKPSQTSKLPDSTYDRLTGTAHTFIEKAKESISHLVTKLTGSSTTVEDTPEAREAIGKELKREDELTDLAFMPSSAFEEKTRIQKLSEKGEHFVESVKEKFTSEKQEKEGEHQTRLQKLTEKGQHFVEGVKEKFTSGEQEKGNEDGTQKFVEVKEGISETIDDLRREQGEEEVQKELHSKNPFEALGTEDTNIEDKSLSTKNSLGEKISQTKEKVKSAFAPKDKENAVSESTA